MAVETLVLPSAALDAISLETIEGRRVAGARLGQHRGMRALKLNEAVSARAVAPAPRATTPAVADPRHRNCARQGETLEMGWSRGTASGRRPRPGPLVARTGNIGVKPLRRALIRYDTEWWRETVCRWTDAA